jgi:hypothetical protein
MIPPEQYQLPELGHLRGQRHAGRHQRQRRNHHVAHAEALHQDGGERSHQAEQRKAQGQRGRDLFDIPAELLGQRLQQGARQPQRRRRAQRGQESQGDDHPGKVQATAVQPIG